MRKLSRFLFLLEIVPLLVFVAIRALDLDMTQRILVAGGCALTALLLLRVLRVSYSPLFFATNVFFVFAASLLLSPFDRLSAFFLYLGEVGMFVTILLIGFIWLLSQDGGLFSPTEAAGLPHKRYSWWLLLVYAACLPIAWKFKGNENLAGALPFMLITVAEKLFYKLQLRDMKRGA
ncbi:hypothetical protein ACS5PK_13115 [Roseateles sp. DB2]|uniref:hypothetical protein n=1 Tax=Roseateles sp. DB2 TaxID=3453717 RepID=UPI003EE974AD